MLTSKYAKNFGYTTRCCGQSTWGARYRLGGHLGHFYGSIHQPLEVNSQARSRHLGLGELKALGPVLIISSQDFLDSDIAQSLQKSISDLLARRADIAKKLKRRSPNKNWRVFETELQIQLHLNNPEILEREPLNLTKKEKREIERRLSTVKIERPRQ